MIKILIDNLKKSSFDIEDKGVYKENKIFLNYTRLLFLIGYFFSIITLFWVTFFPNEVVLNEVSPKSVKQHLKIKRGAIYDRTGRVLAHTLYLPSLHCSPKDIAEGEEKDPEKHKELKKEFAQKIAEAFNLDKDQVLEKINASAPDIGYLKDSIIMGPVKDLLPYELEAKVYELNEFWKEKVKEGKEKKNSEDSSWFNLRGLVEDLLGNLQKSIRRIESLLWEEPREPKVADTKGPPLFVRYNWVREYPHKDIAGNIIGFASFNDKGGYSRFVGTEGLELELEKYLSSEELEEASSNRENVVKILRSDGSKVNDVYLTIDLEIQTCLEKELDKRIEECYAEDGMGVVLDPHTGAILAMASRPSYDPNSIMSARPDAFKNKVIRELFEPGSTLKIVTASAGLELNKVGLYTPIDCERGSYRVGKKIIRDVHAMGVVPFWECFEQSSNVAFVKVGMMVGLETLKEYVRKFGFGEKASYEFRHERIGAISSNTALTTLSSMSIGYSVAVTALQLARAYAVIANGGYLVDTFIVDKVVTEVNDETTALSTELDEKLRDILDESPEKISNSGDMNSDKAQKKNKVLYAHEVRRKRIISEDTAEKVKMLCHQVILKGTGRSALIPEYKAGGKTGTAHLAKTVYEGGGYDPNKIVSLFAGFAPLKNPRIVVVIVIRYPHSKIRYGGYVCGPVFRNVVYHTLTYLNVPPEPVDLKEIKKGGFLAQESYYEDDNDTINFAEFEPLLPLEDSDQPATITRVAGTKSNLEPSLTHNIKQVNNQVGHETNELSKSKSLSSKNIEDIVSYSKLSRTMPNLIGLTKLQAMEILDSLGLGYECNGYGRVVSQYPSPGDSIEGVDLCVLNFSSSLSKMSMKK